MRCMRRKDKEIKDFCEIETLLKEIQVCHLGMIDGDIPYVVPMNFAYKDKNIYIHCASTGKKIDALKKCNNVCVEFEMEKGIERNGEPCDWGTRYASVIAFGKAYFLQTNKEKAEALNLIVSRYSGRNDHVFPENELKHTAVIRIELSEITGKKDYL